MLPTNHSRLVAVSFDTIGDLLKALASKSSTGINLIAYLFYVLTSLSNDTLCIYYCKCFSKQNVSYLYNRMDIYAGILEINRICPLSLSLSK